jgi:uncharacterized protein (DUF1330 family)
MAALLIINYGDVLDEDQLKAYRGPAAKILVEDHKGEAVVFTDQSSNMGEGYGAGAHTVVLKYDSVEAAEQAYQCDEYQDILGQRLAATRSGFSMVVPMID